MRLLSYSLFILGFLLACETETPTNKNNNSTNINDPSAGTNVVHNKEDEPKTKETSFEYTQFEEANMFTIEIPKHFTQKREEKKGTDLVYFFQPKDEEITFFCVPLYAAANASIEGLTIDEATEKVELKDKMPDPHSSVQREVEFFRIVANDGSYIREYIQDDFMYAGMIFKDDAIQEKYQEAFAKFRKSATNLTDS